MKKLSKILWGIALVAVGGLLVLNALKITNFDLFFNGWWTLLIIVPCLIGLFTEREKIGNLLLLCCQGVMTFGLFLKLMLPAVIILLGLKLIFGGIFGNKSHQIIKELEASGKTLKSGYAAFAGTNLDYSGQVFEGAELTAVFGGVKCDLTQAVIEKDCVIHASAIFGGIDILVPGNVNVKVNSTSVFGGVSDKKHPNSPENAVTLYVNGTCVFGGVDIK